jgi:hypothetical protein
MYIRWLVARTPFTITLFFRVFFVRLALVFYRRWNGDSATSWVFAALVGVIVGDTLGGSHDIAHALCVLIGLLCRGLALIAPFREACALNHLNASVARALSLSQLFSSNSESDPRRAPAVIVIAARTAFRAHTPTHVYILCRVKHCILLPSGSIAH